VPTTEERKVVTVLFADLAGSTALASRLDPERFREVIGAFYQMVSGELESLRGRVEKFVGDAVMAVFGLPTSHEDDAIRAIRAGFIIRDRTERLGEALGLPMPLRVRVGINSGPVATGSGPAGQFFVAGAPVNMATRLEKAAAPDEILVGETTWQLARHSVEFGPARAIQAKGFEDAVTAWPVLELSTRSTRRTIPLVDRRRELALLQETFGRVMESGRAHMMTLLGEAGIGKSRLVDEFVAGLEDRVKVLFGRASEFHEDVSFAPVAEMIRRVLGVERDTPRPVVRERLHEVVEGCCDPTEVERVAGRLGLVLGLGADIREADPEQFWSENLARFEAYVEGDGREGSRFRAAELRAGLLELLTGLSAQGPVVMVFEDLDMAQPELLDLVEQILRGARRLPLFVVCVARDHLLENRPGWGGGIPDALALRLDPLSLEDAAELAGVAAEELDEETAGRIAAHAGGNPFFIIETTGMLTEEHPEHLIGAAHSHLLPPTVQAVVASRIDHLSEETRDLARKASVFPGGRFELSELSLITDPRPEAIKALEDSELIVRDRERDGAWRFRHDVLRDVAYESLPKRERGRLHVQVAEGLEKRDHDRYPQSVAWHLEQAALAALDLEPGDRTLAQRAVKALWRAGDLARRRMESRTAIDLYERALALSGPEKAWGIQEARILSAVGESRYWLGEYDEAERTLSRALELGGKDRWTQSLAFRFLADIALNVRGELDRAETLFDQALQAARQLKEDDQPWVIARVLLMAGWVPYWKRDLARARATFEEALEIARGNPDDRWGEARALVSLASTISQVGSEEDCLPLVQEALELGRKMDDPFTVAVAQESVGNSLRRMLRLEEALPYLEEAVGTFRDLGARWEIASALGDRAFIHRLAGRADEAREDFREALDLCRRLGEKSLVTWTAAQLALVLLATGDVAAARKLVEDPAVQAARGDTSAQADLQTATAVVDLAEGDEERARQRLGDVMRMQEFPRNALADRVWFIARLLGDDAAGGAEAVDEARRTLEQARWSFAFRNADLAVEAVQAVGVRAGSNR
jgi:class 3 adenylate cyclase/tetratricopeptide (TPR) repeat protein